VSLEGSIKKYAMDELGFELVGITSASPLDDSVLLQWIENCHHASMGYMARSPEKRCDPRELVSSAKSVICVGSNYYPGNHPPVEKKAGKISRYAWGEDYHIVIREKLERLIEFIKEVEPDSTCKICVDTAPLLERALAARAGLGFFGKNTCLISHEIGSWFFLGEVITDLKLEMDEQVEGDCGSCTKCQDACPQNALIEPYVLDARKCNSYLTIEHKGDIPEEREKGIGDQVFGCDRCQEVCPYNNKVQLTRIEEFKGEKGFGPYLDLQGLDVDDLNIRLKRTALERVGISGINRNFIIVSKNEKSGSN